MQASQRLAIEIVNDFLQQTPVDLNGMAQAMGLEVLEDRGFSDEISGMIERRSDGKFRIRVNARHHPNRKRFTLAHEIAHYVLHRDLIGTGVTDNALYRSTTLSDSLESQANRYAAGLLMPEGLVRQKRREGMLSYAQMAEVFGVSPDAARIRLRELRVG
jgi:Zn-dependent peptidase ImmA (M78 family)